MKKYSIEEMELKAEKMQSFLELPLPSEPNELIERLEKIDILMAQSGKMLADAKFHKDSIVNGTIMEMLKKSYEEKLSASVLNKFIETAAKDQAYLVNWIDRINATSTHVKDSIRTIISYRKKELEL